MLLKVFNKYNVWITSQFRVVGCVELNRLSVDYLDTTIVFFIDYWAFFKLKIDRNQVEFVQYLMFDYLKIRIISYDCFIDLLYYSIRSVTCTDLINDFRRGRGHV